MEILISYINPKAPAKNDLQAISRGTLADLRKDLQKAVDAGPDKMVEYHYRDIEEMIEFALDNR